MRGSPSGFTGFIAESTERLRDRLLATGLIEAAEVDATIAMLRDPASAFLTFECWIASGRRPPTWPRTPT